MSNLTGLMLASIITGAVGAHGLVFGGTSSGEILRGFFAGASFSVIMAASLALLRWVGIDVSPQSHRFRVLAVALGSVSGALAGGLWFATQYDPAPLYLCTLVGGIIGLGFGWAGSQQAISNGAPGS